jgi:hypothetical protein
MSDRARDDFGFVFGKALKPRNRFDARAGLDVSPAGFAGWRFIDAAAVPAGP